MADMFLPTFVRRSLAILNNFHAEKKQTCRPMLRTLDP